MRNRSILAFAGCLLLGAIATTGTAQAAPAEEWASCITNGADGSSNVRWWGGITEEVSVSLNVNDLRADGNHVAVRLLTHDSNGDRHNWSWHHWYGGKDTGHYWDTTAQDSSKGIRDAGVQVARFEGDNLLDSCTSWGN
ncbi:MULTISPECIES: hypothetical protein [unclassified Streptomyces]|uniref:hypothetical protein n=1 Tax=unclassified Streptomyces TaxID=2593676 RepID=UPI0036EFBF8E